MMPLEAKSIKKIYIIRYAQITTEMNIKRYNG